MDLGRVGAELLVCLFRPEFGPQLDVLKGADGKGNVLGGRELRLKGHDPLLVVLGVDLLAGEVARADDGHLHQLVFLG